MRTIKMLRNPHIEHVMFEIGVQHSNKVVIDNLRYERPQVGEYYDDNWVACRIAVYANSFSGKYSASLQAADFPKFLGELETLYERLAGEATFCTIEGQLYMRAVGDGRGHIRVDVEAIDEPGIGASIKFQFDIDQTDLLSSIRQLRNVVKQYPVRSA